MKKYLKTYIFVLLLLVLLAPVLTRAEGETEIDLGKDDLNNAVGQIDGVVEDVTSVIPDEFDGFFAKVEVFRIAQLERFQVKLEELRVGTLDEMDIGEVTLNETGNVEISTGINEVKESPTEFIKVSIYAFLVFIFGTVIIFYSVCVLLVLWVLKTITTLLFKKS